MKVEVTKEFAANVHADIMRGLARPPAGSPPSTGTKSNPGAKTGRIPKVTDSLRRGVLDPSLSPDDPEVQNLARLAWRLEPPTLWILALSIVEGPAFAFREALDRHLEEEEGRQSRILLKSRLVRSLAAALQALGQASEKIRQVRENFLAWEQQTRRVVMPLPSPALYGADEEVGPSISSEVFDDGLELSLESVTSLVLVATQPVSAGTEPLQVQIIGEEGEEASHRVDLLPTGEYAGARVALGPLEENVRRMGNECVVLVTKGPLPDILR